MNRFEKALDQRSGVHCLYQYCSSVSKTYLFWLIMYHVVPSCCMTFFLYLLFQVLYLMEYILLSITRLGITNNIGLVLYVLYVYIVFL